MPADLRLGVGERLGLALSCFLLILLLRVGDEGGRRCLDRDLVKVAAGDGDGESDLVRWRSLRWDCSGGLRAQRTLWRWGEVVADAGRLLCGEFSSLPLQTAEKRGNP